MNGRVMICKGAPYKIGRAHGRFASPLVRSNIAGFWRALATCGYSKKKVVDAARAGREFLDSSVEEEIAGIADGAQLPYEEVLAYNLYREAVAADECTVMMAIGSASATGDTVFAKNSDKVGDQTLVGPNFYRYKEINVLAVIEREDGLKIVGVAAAGSQGLKMGLNSCGIAAGANIARTRELYEKKPDITTIRALDRGYLVRQGLEKRTVLEAVHSVVSRITEVPMGTPGNIEFADARTGFIIEGSYDRTAVKKVVDDIDSRANRFVVLGELNKPDDVSSICRYYRTQQLLGEKKGKVTLEDMIAISMDHANGPGPNSVCRHSEDFREEVSLSSMVMEINGKNPEKSRFAVCLGKPCHAWRDPRGHLIADMTVTAAEVPAGFLNGEIFKEFYTEEARFE